MQLGDGAIWMPNIHATLPGYDCVPEFRVTGSQGGKETGYTTNRCYPRPAAPAASVPTSITVSPTIQTQVSPQISPIFQQQFQPSGSPLTAGTVQTGVTAQSQLPPAPSPEPAAAPSYVPPPVQYTPSAQLPSAPAPLPSSIEPIQSEMATTAPAPLFDWKIAAIIGLGLFGVMALRGKKGK